MAFANLKKEKPAAQVVEQYEAPNLFYLTGQYKFVEKLCEEAIGRQDGLARSYYQHFARSRDQAEDPVETREGDMLPRARMSVSDLPFNDLRHLNRIAKNVVPNGLPGANRRFLINACTPELADIEVIEEEIKLLRYRMSVIEQEILDHTPRSSEEAVEKLKFISSIMLDGGSMEVDFFAYLVEECAFVLSEERG